MRIVFDPTSLHQGKSGAITGVIYFEFERGQQFPGEGWSDFVVVVLNWWFDALNELAQGELTTDFRFMDGPFWVTANKCGKGVSLRGVEDRTRAEYRPESVVGLDEIRRELLLTARQVSKSCTQAGIHSVELAELRKHLPN